METDAYENLAQHLDKLPGGFPPSDSGVELRLLKRLFTPEEAELAVHLTLDREEAKTIAERAGLDLAQAEQMLKEMARKGLIFSIEPEGGPALYQAVPWMFGIYEFQVNNLDEGFVQDFSEYNRTRGTAQGVRFRGRNGSPNCAQFLYGGASNPTWRHYLMRGLRS